MSIENLETIVEPVQEPITLAQVYELMRLDALGSPPSHPHDNLLIGMIRASREWVENYTKRALVQQTVRLVVPTFPRFRILMSERQWDDDAYETRSGSIELRRPPLIEVLSIAYYDLQNVQQLVDLEDVVTSKASMVPEIRMKNEHDWPQTYPRRDAVQITYTVGYPPAGSPTETANLTDNIPQSIKQAILIGVQLQYDDVTPETRTALENLRVSLLGSYRVYSF